MHFKKSSAICFNPFPDKPWFLRICSTSLENSVGKGEIALKKQFLLFPQHFLTFQKTFHHFHQLKKCCLQTLPTWENLKVVIWERVDLDQSKILSSGNGLIDKVTTL